MTRAPVTAGSQLAGRYRLVEPLPHVAEGVWRVRDDIGDRDAAALALQLAPDDEQETRYQRSVRQVRDASQLRHDSIMSVYDVVEHDGTPWIVTELVTAPSLEHLLRTRGPVTPVEAARIGLGVIEALQVADRSGVRHRDLTPLNVLVGEAGRVTVAGFGVTPESVQRPGRAATAAGSADFMAPERARGAPSTLASDLWSLGATLYAAVEGRLPFHRDAALATLTAVVTDEPPPPRRAGALRPVIDGLLIKDPEHRLGLADARRMLDGVVRGVPVPAPRRAVPASGPNGMASRAVPSVGAVGAGRPAGAGAGASGAMAGNSSAGGSTSAVPGGGTPTEGAVPPRPRTSAAGPAAAGPGAAGPGAAAGAAGTGADARLSAGTSSPGPNATPSGGVAPAGSPRQSTEAGSPAAGTGRSAQTEAAGSGDRGSAAGSPPPSGTAAGQPDAEADEGVHDPEIVAALAAFEAALGPITRPRPPATPARDDEQVSGAGPAPRAAEEAADRYPGDKPTADTRSLGSPTTGGPTGRRPTADDQVDDQPTGNRTTDNRPTSRPADPRAGNPTTDNRTIGNRTTDNRPTSRPADPRAGNPTTDNRTIGNPTTGNRTAGGQAAKPPASRPSAPVTPPLPPAATRPPADRLPYASTPPLPPPLRPVNGQPTAARPPTAGARPASAVGAEGNGHAPSSARTQPPLAPTPLPRTPAPRIDDLHGGGPHRRPSLITITALVLVVVAAVLVPYLIDRSRGDGLAATAPGTPTAAATTANASPTASPEPAAAPPAGFRLHRDPTGFSIAVPSGWREERDGSLVDFHDPTSSRFIRIDQREDPRTEPYDDWIGQEPTYKRRLPGYDLIRIANVQYRGWRTADWEFTWGASGSERSHVRIRNVVPNDFHGYALYWSTADSDWAKDLPYFDVFVRTFAPKAGR